MAQTIGSRGIAAPQGGFKTSSQMELLGESGAQFTPVAKIFGIENVPTDVAAQLMQRQMESNRSAAGRAQLMQLLGLSSETLGPGGLLGQNFFQNVLQGTPAGLAGSVGGALAPVIGGSVGGGAGGVPPIGQPGGPDSPGAPAGGVPGTTPPAGGGSLFQQLLSGRGALGGEMLRQLAGFGESRRGQIQQGAQTALNTALARQEARGFGSGSLATTLPIASEEATQRSLGELEDQLTAQRLGVMGDVGEGIFGDIGGEIGRQAEFRGDILDLFGGLLGDIVP